MSDHFGALCIKGLKTTYGNQGKFSQNWNIFNWTHAQSFILYCYIIYKPFNYYHFSYVFIPVLPASLLDFLTAPTPFLMGVHMSYEDQIPEMVRCWIMTNSSILVYTCFHWFVHHF